MLRVVMLPARRLLFAVSTLVVAAGSVVVGANARAKGKAAPGGAASPAAKASPLRIEIDKSRIDLQQHRLEVKMSRKAGKISIHVQGESGATLAEEEQDFSGREAGSPLIVTWTPSSSEVVSRIEIKATDAYGYFTGMIISSYFLLFEHDDVNFKTGSAEIETAEVPKLEAARVKMASKIASIRAQDINKEKGNLTLYIAGHTDTVGGFDYNLSLSRDRARAIASWFRKQNLDVHIACEGFGESAPVVQTADQVDEPRNRRVDYIIGDNEPTIKATGFKPSWKRIK